ncbi:amidase [Catenulispora rubra]|uniref:amidase n=1 Tax=Catenulispora rubra TaxID=280293 RepID=UPI001892383B|nr:amidase [Catenulispora rubra]
MQFWEMSATEITAGVRDRTFSAEEVMRSCLDRIEAVNPVLNALIDVRPEEALADARRADQAVAAGERLGPLHGVPVSTKIDTDQAGRICSLGLVSQADAVADGDAACVAALRDAGAVFVGKSNAPAWSLRWFATNDAHGRTLNPWDADRTPGGSSGGAASSVASGMTPVAHGNDIGGSIRYPAACCGIVGIRPTVGLVPNLDAPGAPEMDMPLTVQTWVTHGPLARNVADVRAALYAMAVPDLRDPFGAAAVRRIGAAPGPTRVIVVRDVGMAKPHAAVNTAIDRAAAWLADAGYEIEETDVPQLAEAARLWHLLLGEDMRTAGPMFDELGDEAFRVSSEYGRQKAAEYWGETPDLEAYINGWARRGTLVTQLQTMLGANTMVLTPASAEPPLEQDADILDPQRALEAFDAMWPMISVPALGFPAVTVPAGEADGLPLSVQLIGGKFTEDVILDAAQAIEDRAPRLTPVMRL